MEELSEISPRASRVERKLLLQTIRDINAASQVSMRLCCGDTCVDAVLYTSHIMLVYGFAEPIEHDKFAPSTECVVSRRIQSHRRPPFTHETRHDSG